MTEPAAKLYIRAADRVDAPPIAQVVNNAYRPAVGYEGWTHEGALVRGKRIDAEQVRAAIELSTVLVAERDKCIVGCVQIERQVGEARIGMLAVEPGLQGGGLGNRLLAEAERYAQEQFDPQQFVLLVITSRRELINFYERRGYRATTDLIAFPRDAGVGTPVEADIGLTVLRKNAARQHCS